MTKFAQFQRRFLPVTLSLAVIGLVSACLPDEPSIYDVEEQHPQRVSSEVVSLPVAINPGKPNLASGDIRRLDALLRDFLRRGGGVLEISITGPSRHSINIINRAGQVRRHALLRGVQQSEIRINTMRDSEDSGNAIVVSYERFTVKQIVCGSGGIGSTRNSLNVTHPNFGCSTQANIAAMVSNPSDLVRSRERQAPDTSYFNKSLNAYRGGKK